MAPTHSGYSDDYPALTGWHAGEREVQARLGFQAHLIPSHTIIEGYLSPQHRSFHTEVIEFLPFASRSTDGRVWASILAPASPHAEFISSKDSRHLTVNTNTWEGDPIRESIREQLEGDPGVLVAGVGVALDSRRRNKLAGKTLRASWSGDDLSMGIEVNEACGNCPKYIQSRKLEPASGAEPSVATSSLKMDSSDRLPPDVVSFIHSCDTLFLATSHRPAPSDAEDYPAHLGCNHRGGRPGFVRVRSDGRTLVLPDFSGNRLMTSLGNIVTDSNVGVVFVDFPTGDVLYITGDATLLFHDDAKKVMPRVKLITLIQVTGYTLVRSALPFREVPGTYALSPYCPPLYLLAEEQSTSLLPQSSSATISNVVLHSDSLATFSFKTSTPIQWQAGQYVILDTTALIGEMGYAHMSPGDEKRVNEDGIRTWSISSSPTKTSDSFNLTIRRLPNGRVTSLLFAVAQACLSAHKSFPPIALPLLGTAGSFVLPPPGTPIVAIAGGIGITPFLSFLTSIVRSDDNKWEMKLVVSTREVGIMYELVRDSIGVEGRGTTTLELELHFFNAHEQVPPPQLPDYEATGVKVVSRVYSERLSSGFWEGKAMAGSKYYVCGPKPFEDSVLAGLVPHGIDPSAVIRESFAF